jgi:hypothetical protein
VSPMRYELVFYIPEDDILHSRRRENLRSYTENSCSVLMSCCSLELVCKVGDSSVIQVKGCVEC